MVGRRSEIAEVDVADDIGPFRARQQEIVGRESMSPTARSGVGLHEYCAGLLATLKLDEMVTASERPELFDAPFGPSLSTKRRLPVVVDRHAMALGAAAVETGAVLVDIVFGAASDQV